MFGSRTRQNGSRRAFVDHAYPEPQTLSGRLLMRVADMPDKRLLARMIRNAEIEAARIERLRGFKNDLEAQGLTLSFDATPLR